ncbi:MAG: hypothetical protein ACLP7Q_25435 [Isosphaeraceae bacterium]
MAKTIVYVETTIPSFYHEDRTEPGIVVSGRATGGPRRRDGMSW